VPLTQWLFETERLAVRPKAAADAESLRFVAAHMRHQETYGFSMWALAERSSGTLVGDVGFLIYEDGVEIGWHLCRSAWGQGYATEAARAALAYGFEELGFTRVSAFTELANAASIRVIEKLGMTFVRGGADGVTAWAEYAVSAPRTPGRASP
jgi:ribosomal-protein-alanine N-acetyltransferase